MDLSGSTILLTGGTGSFGTAFVERVVDDHPGATLRIFSRDELKQSEMQARFADRSDLRFFVGDVRNHIPARRLSTRQAISHPVERSRQVAKLVVRRDIDALAQIASLHVTRGSCQSLHGGQNLPRKPQDQQHSPQAGGARNKHQRADRRRQQRLQARCLARRPNVQCAHRPAHVGELDCRRLPVPGSRFADEDPFGVSHNHPLTIGDDNPLASRLGQRLHIGLNARPVPVPSEVHAQDSREPMIAGENAPVLEGLESLADELGIHKCDTPNRSYYHEYGRNDQTNTKRTHLIPRCTCSPRHRSS